MNTYNMIERMVNDGALIPIDVATQLVNEGYDITPLVDALDGYSVQDLIDRYEEVYG